MRRRVKLTKLIGIAGACLILAGTIWATQSPSSNSGELLTLDEAVRQALESNPMVQVSTAGKAAAAAQVQEAKAGLLPFLEFRQDYTHSNNPVFVFGSLLEQGRFGTANFAIDSLNNPPSINNYRSTLNLNVPVFNRFQNRSQIQQATIREEQADFDSVWIAQQIRFQVIQAYYGVLLSDARKDVASEAVRTAEAEVEAIRSRLEQGLVVKSDLLAMEVQLAEFRQRLTHAGGAVETARAALNTVLGLPIGTMQRIAGKLEERTFPVPPQEELIRVALQQRPDNLRVEKEVDAAQQKIRSAKGQFWPDLNLFASGGASSQNLHDGSSDFAVGARLTFKIVDFGRNARINQAVAAADGARAQQKQKANEVQLEVVEAYQGFLTAQEQLQVAGAAVDQAEEVLRIIQDRNDAGLTTITEVLRAQTALLRAKMNLQGARYNYYLGFARTLLASGGLTDVKGLTS